LKRHEKDWVVERISGMCYFSEGVGDTHSVWESYLSKCD
jgi:hypothetical protein